MYVEQFDEFIICLHLVWLSLMAAKIENYNSIATWSVSQHFDWTDKERCIYIGWSESHPAMLCTWHTVLARNGKWQQCDNGGAMMGKAMVMIEMSLVTWKQPASLYLHILNCQCDKIILSPSHCHYTDTSLWNKKYRILLNYLGKCGCERESTSNPKHE
jgi:hypothetical protein